MEMKVSELRKMCKFAKEMGLKRLKTPDFELEFDNQPSEVGVPTDRPGFPSLPLNAWQDQTKVDLKTAPNVQAFIENTKSLIPGSEEIQDEDMLFWSSPIYFDESPQDPSVNPPAV